MSPGRQLWNRGANRAYKAQASVFRKGILIVTERLWLKTHTLQQPILPFRPLWLLMPRTSPFLTVLIRPPPLPLPSRRRCRCATSKISSCTRCPPDSVIRGRRRRRGGGHVYVSVVVMVVTVSRDVSFGPIVRWVRWRERLVKK